MLSNANLMDLLVRKHITLSFDFLRCDELESFSVKKRSDEHQERINLKVAELRSEIRLRLGNSTRYRHVGTQTDDSNVSNHAYGSKSGPIASKSTTLGLDSITRIQKYWEIEFSLSQDYHDSEIFVFGGISWRISFAADSDGVWKCLLLPVELRATIRVVCEIKIVCLLKPVYTKTTRLIFSPMSSWKGIDKFIGPDVLSYVEHGRLTLCIKMALCDEESIASFRFEDFAASQHN